MRFLTSLQLEEWDSRRWRLVTPLAFQLGAGVEITVPAGFITDLASTPRFLWPIFPPHGAHQRAAVLHDWLYSRPDCPRVIADAVFVSAMKPLGVAAWRRWAMYFGVRLCGWACRDPKTLNQL